MTPSPQLGSTGMSLLGAGAPIHEATLQPSPCTLWGKKKKKRGMLNSHLSSLPDSSQAWNSWLGWQSGTFCRCRLHVRGAALKISLVPAASPCHLPRLLGCAPRLTELPQCRRSPPQGEVGNRWKSSSSLSPFLTPLHAAGEGLLRKTVGISRTPPSNCGCGAPGCV